MTRRANRRTNRRSLLAAIGAGGAGAVAGCLDGGGAEAEPNDDGSDGDGRETDGPENDSTGSDDGGDGTSGDAEASAPEPDGTCGSDAEPLSSVLVAEADQDAGTCVEDMTPSFVVANERDEPVTATVEIGTGERTTHEETYSLEPDERAVERDVGAAADLESVTISLEGGESFAGEWSGLVCYRHAATITDDGVDAGYVEPLSGPGDTQHDCYAGDPVPITLRSETDRTASIAVVDHCRESTAEETVALEAEGVERLAGALSNGGRYDVAVAVEDGGAAVESFHDACWGLSVSIDADGEPAIEQLAID